MPNELIKFWKDCKLDKPPFFHPKDKDLLWQEKDKKHKFININSKNFEEYRKSSSFGDDEDKRLHLSLRPVPYLGNLAKAEIFILLLNPGLAYSDYWAESKSKAFRQRLEDNLQQSFSGNYSPFFKLDPQFCWCSGFDWWESKLHEVIKLIAEHKKVKYVDAMLDLSTKLACLELVPYHSSSFGSHSLLKNLPSVKMMKKFVQETLVPEANKDKRTLIVTRLTKEWGFHGTKSTDNLVIYDKKHARGASLSPKSDGGKAILRRYGIELASSMHVHREKDALRG